MNTKTTKPFEMWTAWDRLGRHDCRPVIVISLRGRYGCCHCHPSHLGLREHAAPTHVLVSNRALTTPAALYARR